MLKTYNTFSLILVYLLCFPYKIIGDVNITISIRVGLVYEETADPLTGKVTLAMAESNLRNSNVIQENIQFQYFQMSGCQYASGAGPCVELYYQHNVDVIIGPGCDTALLVCAAATPSWNLLNIGYASTAAALAESVYGTFARVSYSDLQVAFATINVLLTFGWEEFGMIRSSSTDCDSFSNSVQNLAQIVFNDVLIPNMTISMQASFNFNQLDSYASSMLFSIMRSSARIFVLCAGYDPHDARTFFLMLAQQNLTGPEFQYIVPVLRKNDAYTWQFWETPVDDGQNAIAKEAFKRVIVVNQEANSTSTVSAFNAKLLQMMNGPPWNANVQSLNASEYVRYLHDAMYLYGMGINESLKYGTDKYRDGSGMMNVYLAFRKFNGATGLVSINSYGDRVPQFSLSSFDSSDNFNLMAFMSLLAADIYGWQSPNITWIRKPFWNTLDNVQPLTTPICGFNADRCVDTNIVAIIIGPVAAVVAILLVASVIVWRLRQIALEGQLMEMTWKIEPHEVRRIHRGRTSRNFDDGTTGSGSLSGSGDSKSNSVNRSHVLSESNAKFLLNKAPFLGVGIYRDQSVAVKQIRQYQPGVVFSKKELIELHALKEMRHENLNSFIGLILPEAPPALILWGYCQRGSLEDILFNDAIELDMMFKSSMIKDIIKGLDYLHKSSLGVHGSVTTSNCVIDSRWVLKLTDFGLHQIISKCSAPPKPLNDKNDNMFSTSLYHLAPEVLRQSFEKFLYEPKKEGDIYSLGMVIFQIIYREQPFTDMTITPAAIVRKIAYPGPTYEILRPKFPRRSSQVSVAFKQLITICWEEIPSQRPSLATVTETVVSSTKQFSANIVDHVISTMEKYTETLEKVVEERSKELNEEKTKADALLREMLPRTIVDDLKAGKSVAPESYDSVTIYFSDIVGFTTISGNSTPLEVITMLNLLYSTFDNIVKQYDVYKVETIGDAYMVASGLPIRNGMRHGLEIANMALHVRKFVLYDFNIPHRPTERLQIRIGCHTGPVAAGVIGLAMPRYCVFGDTVNTASRMESTGEPMKIQVSNALAKLLRERGNYVIEPRGLVQLKDIGETETYWLVDKAKGF